MFRFQTTTPTRIYLTLKNKTYELQDHQSHMMFKYYPMRPSKPYNVLNVLRMKTLETITLSFITESPCIFDVVIETMLKDKQHIMVYSCLYKKNISFEGKDLSYPSHNIAGFLIINGLLWNVYSNTKMIFDDIEYESVSTVQDLVFSKEKNPSDAHLIDDSEFHHRECINILTNGSTIEEKLEELKIHLMLREKREKEITSDLLVLKNGILDEQYNITWVKKN